MYFERFDGLIWFLVVLIWGLYFGFLKREGLVDEGGGFGLGVFNYNL